jgi:RimJ/RimL family protein N-acetyltransferase
MNMDANAWPLGPVVETPRLRLRPHRLDDLDARTTMTGNDYVMRFFPDTQSREDNWARLLRYAGHWALLGWGLFAVEEKATGRFVGEVGLADFGRNLGKDFDGIPEAGWILDQWAEGQGFATEAIRASIGWYEQTFGIARQVCIIAPENAPSRRVAEKIGFKPYAERLYHDHRVLLHERLPAQAG